MMKIKALFSATKLKLRAFTLTGVLLCMIFGTETRAEPANNTPTVIDPTQSITYWKNLIIQPESSDAVTHAQQVFDTLLRSWDRSRVAPRLFVVKSENGPWAASLADGSILLSLSALHISQKFGPQRADHLLAFVLAHELAHQRADDMWHQKFLRIAATQSATVRQQLFRGLKLDNESISDLAEREAQADHDGLIIMSSVGYDPYQVINNKDFFTAWVEQIWNSTCTNTEPGKTGTTNITNNKEACEQAKTRALRAQSQLNDVANQATLYQLGVYAYVSRDYATATRYFLAYGKQYPSRATFTSLGLVELAQALTLRSDIDRLSTSKQATFYYPLVLDSTPGATPIHNDSSTSAKRSNPDIYLTTLEQRLENHIKQAVIYFQQAAQLEPEHPNAYLYQAMSYLVNHNTYMSRGILQGQYIPRFGSDPAVNLLIALTTAQEGNYTQAANELNDVIQQARLLPDNYNRLNANAILYAGVFNAAALALFKQENSSATKLWQQLASYSKASGKNLLFRLALEQLNTAKTQAPLAALNPRVRNLRLGDTLKTSSFDKLITKDNTVWINGDKLQLIMLQGGESYILNTENKVVSAWQAPSAHAQLDKLHLGDNIDRPFKLYGVPSRHLHLASGDYLAYDQYGVAIHLLDDKITGWFLYQP